MSLLMGTQPMNAYIRPDAIIDRYSLESDFEL